MSRSIRLRRVAQIEFDKAIDWYESRSAGTGFRFQAVVNKALKNISQYPDRWPEIYPGIRQYIFLKWPFFICYETYDEYILVLAIYSTSLDSDGWTNRIR